MIGGSSYGNRSTLIKGEYVDARSIARRHAQHGRVASMETKMPARTYRVSKRNNRLGTKPEAAFSVAFLHSPASTRRAPSKHLAKFKAILAGRRQCQTLLSLAPTALPWQE